MENLHHLWVGKVKPASQIYEASTEGMFMPERDDTYLPPRVCRHARKLE
jgi:hypothetical protein